MWSATATPPGRCKAQAARGGHYPTGRQPIAACSACTQAGDAMLALLDILLKAAFLSFLVLLAAAGLALLVNILFR